MYLGTARLIVVLEGKTYSGAAGPLQPGGAEVELQRVRK